MGIFEVEFHGGSGWFGLGIQNEATLPQALGVTTEDCPPETNSDITSCNTKNHVEKQHTWRIFNPIPHEELAEIFSTVLNTIWGLTEGQAITMRGSESVQQRENEREADDFEVTTEDLYRLSVTPSVGNLGTLPDLTGK
nr:hypothetical protein Iba_chr02bCG19420 [Ipomoea batatas]